MAQINTKTTGDIVAITCYYNPNGYKTKRQNYDLFAQGISDTGGTLYTIECAFNDDQFDLPVSENNIKVHSSSVLWQKERLLNILITKLPPHITKVAWLDCDLIFENKNWLADTSQLLDTYKVVQPFEMAVRLPYGDYQDKGDGERHVGFAATFARNPLSAIVAGEFRFTRHGHSGFAWAARRDVLKHGLYDGCISGNGDHLMSHAFVGDWETGCFRPHFEENPFYWQHFESWCIATYPNIRASLGYVPGKILHLWHGESDERKYMERNADLNAFQFDPANDLHISENGCFEWNSNKPDLHKWAQRYFHTRFEDGKSTIFPTKEKLIARLERAKDRACSDAHVSRINGTIHLVQNAASIAEAVAVSKLALGL